MFRRRTTHGVPMDTSELPTLVTRAHRTHSLNYGPPTIPPGFEGVDFASQLSADYIRMASDPVKWADYIQERDAFLLGIAPAE